MKTIISVSASRNLENSYLDYKFVESEALKRLTFQNEAIKFLVQKSVTKYVCSIIGLSNPSQIPEHDFSWLFYDIHHWLFQV